MSTTSSRSKRFIRSEHPSEVRPDRLHRAAGPGARADAEKPRAGVIEQREPAVDDRGHAFRYSLEQRGVDPFRLAQAVAQVVRWRWLVQRLHAAVRVLGSLRDWRIM